MRHFLSCAPELITRCATHHHSLRSGTERASLVSTRSRTQTTSSACARTATSTSTVTRSPQAGCSSRAISTSSFAGKPSAATPSLCPRYASCLPSFLLLKPHVLTYTRVTPAHTASSSSSPPPGTSPTHSPSAAQGPGAARPPPRCSRPA